MLVDLRANGTYPLNADRLNELRDAGAPMRRRTASGILHWKMMLFEGQNTVQFSAANYTSAFVPNIPYENYIDDVIGGLQQTVIDCFRRLFACTRLSQRTRTDAGDVRIPCRHQSLARTNEPGRRGRTDVPPPHSRWGQVTRQRNAAPTRAVDNRGDFQPERVISFCKRRPPSAAGVAVGLQC